VVIVMQLYTAQKEVAGCLAPLLLRRVMLRQYSAYFSFIACSLL
jgi:hypothetical protein